MKKVIVNCKKCGQKIKIGYKPAKYRCPHCKEIYVLTKIKSLVLKIKSIFVGMKETILDSIFNVKTKYKNAKATYIYMKNLKKNMKNNPSWSNYYKEQEEEKKIKRADNKFGGRNIFKKK